MRNLLVAVLCQTFNEKVGKHQLSNGQKNGDPEKALLTSFDLHIDYNVESGYRYLDVLIYGPMNYVQVWVRERWTVIPNEDLDYDGDGDATVKPGKDYREGATTWFKAADHDSCWPDGVNRVIRDYEDRLGTFSKGSFYEVVEVGRQGLPNKGDPGVRYDKDNVQKGTAA